jgi:hypothetical protein
MCVFIGIHSMRLSFLVSRLHCERPISGEEDEEEEDEDEEEFFNHYKNDLKRHAHTLSGRRVRWF